jgi:hypothetical protein
LILLIHLVSQNKYCMYDVLFKQLEDRIQLFVYIYYLLFYYYYVDVDVDVEM